MPAHIVLLRKWGLVQTYGGREVDSRALGDLVCPEQEEIGRCYRLSFSRSSFER